MDLRYDAAKVEKVRVFFGIFGVSLPLLVLFLLSLFCCLAAAVGDGLLHAGERILERSDESDLPRSRSDGQHGDAGTFDSFTRREL